MRNESRNLNLWIVVGCLWTLGAPAAAEAQGCTPGPQVYASVLPNCAYGQAQVDGDLVLVPKICRHDLNGRSVVRRSVEVKAVSTGLRVQQAALPPEDSTATSLPAVGQLWPGSPPLLVFSSGIAAIDARAGKADLVLEPTGAIAAVARSGDWLAIIERLPAAGSAPGALEWTVLDLSAGEIVGQVQFGAGVVEGLAWLVQGQARAVVATCAAGTGGKALTLRVQLSDASGKSTVKDQTLEPKASRGAASVAPPVAGLSVTPGDPESRVDIDGLRVEATGPARLSRAASASACLGVAAGSTCLAVNGTQQGKRLVWVQPAKGPRELHACVEP